MIRFIVATRVLTPIIFTQIRDRRRFILFGGARDLTPEQRMQRAEALADAFERLGTTYIKLAQFLTTRPDLVPPTYVRALERLQDEVPAEPYEEIEPLLEEDIGDPDLVFDYFEREAISGASIAQVHRASIRGQPVAVKIRRPGLEKQIEADLIAMSVFAPLGRMFLKLIGQKSHAESAKGITDELKKTLREEIDFAREANIMTELRENFERDGLDDRIVVPYVYPEHTTERVITMAYEDGTKVKYTEELRDQGHDLNDVVDAIADAYLHMAFVYDVFQADPHQGNLAVNEEGQVVIYDYGLSQRPDPATREAFTDMFVGVALHDPDQVIDALHEMGAVDPSMDRDTLRQVSQIMIMDISGHSIDDSDIKEIENKVDQTLYDYPLKFPQDIVLGMRTTFGLEGLCARMSPDYDFTEKLYQFFIGQGIVELEEVEAQVVGDGFVPDVVRNVDRSLGRTGLFSNERPILEFIGRNPGLMAWLPFGDLHLNGAPTNGESRELDFDFGDASKNGELDTEDLKNHIEQTSKETSKRNALGLFGAAMFISGSMLYTAAAPLWWTLFILGGVSFLLVKRSFREGGNVLGPKYVATRHRIEQWDEPGEEDEGGEPEGPDSVTLQEPAADDVHTRGNGDPAGRPERKPVRVESDSDPYNKDVGPEPPTRDVEYRDVRRPR